jgi:hypothetical protein
VGIWSGGRGENKKSMTRERDGKRVRCEKETKQIAGGRDRKRQRERKKNTSKLYRCSNRTPGTQISLNT